MTSASAASPATVRIAPTMLWPAIVATVGGTMPVRESRTPFMNTIGYARGASHAPPVSDLQFQG